MPSRINMLAENTRFLIVFGVLTFIIVLGIIGPFFTTVGPTTAYIGEIFEPPSLAHKLGCDSFGSDVWTQLLHGIRYSLTVGFTAGLISLVIAFLVGGVGAYKGGLIDEGLNLNTNVFLTLPIIPILIILSALLEYRSLFLVAFIIALFGWPGAARAIRSQVLSLKEREFIDLAHVTGKGGPRILFGEIFPNMLAFIFIMLCGMIGGAIIAEAGLSLIGLGPSMIPTLGSMLHWSIMNQALHMGAWWWFVPPGLFLIIFTGSLIMLGSIIDDVLNPKLTGVL